MTRKREAVLLLLGSLDDHLPALGVNFRPTRGLVAAEKRACPDCGHTEQPGWRVDSFKRKSPCVTCGGATEAPFGQWRQKDRGKGFVMVDPMDAEQAPVRTIQQDAKPTKPTPMVDCDGCGGSGLGRPYLDDQGREQRDRDCRHCAGAGKVERRNLKTLAEREPGEPVDATTAAIDKRDTAGDYHALDWALASLKARHRDLVLRVHGPGGTGSPSSDREARLLEAALRLLEDRMPERPRVPGYVRQAAKRTTAPKGAMSNAHQLEQRDKEVRRLIRHGKPRQWVAREYGLSVSQTYAIAPAKTVAA